jgi:hypothetical protein
MPANDDGIVLEAGGSKDTRIYTGNPGNAESYQVDGKSAISGNADPNGTILFRIGLKTAFTAYNEASNPARYAVLLLSYNNYTKHQRIFIRQGEGADYVMRTSDRVIIDGYSRERNVCARFSPYNLTATKFNDTIPVRGGKFTDFPTQAGAIFQWGNPFVRIRHAWDPISAETIPKWEENLSHDYWNTLSASHETCPLGYRRPNDGSLIRAEANTDISRSEMRLSLMANPEPVNVIARDNSIWGFYADGFFDRRSLFDIGSVIAAAPYTNRIAYTGRLFFNPATNASLFFPAAGDREPKNGELMLGRGVYWSSTTGQQDPYGWHLVFDGTAAAMNFSMKSIGASIRCVRQ